MSTALIDTNADMRMRCRAEAAEQRTMECSEKLRAEIAQLQGELSRRAHSPAYLHVFNCKIKLYQHS